MLSPVCPRTIASGMKLVGGSGDMFSSASDMAKWMMFVLRDGKTPDGVSLVPEHAMQQLQVKCYTDVFGA